MLRIAKTIKSTCLVILLAWNNGINCQFNFIRNCNDPLILAHTMNDVTGQPHDFCYHSCGFDLNVLPTPGQGVCTAAGICQCNHPCDSAPPASQFGEQCPAFPFFDPIDPDPTAVPRCVADCASLCLGGIGQVCGETYRAPIPPTTDNWAKICTCFCPVQPCATTIAPVTNTIASKIPLLFIKIAKFVILMTKFCALYWIKIVVFAIGFLFLL